MNLHPRGFEMTVFAPSPHLLPDGSHCPQCGGALELVHRHPIDRWVSVFRSVHRYRCTAAGCDWEGLLGRTDAHATPYHAHRRRLRLAWFAIGAAVAVMAMVGTRAVLRGLDSGAAVRPVAVGGAAAEAAARAPGLDFEGEALPATDPRQAANTTPLTLRHSCAWGVPGGNPYRGTVEQALVAAHLPAEVVRKIADMVERGWVYDQVEISRVGIRTVDHNRQFHREITAMGFGNSLCFGTRVNFRPGHVEYAALYQASDAVGKTYVVMIPYACRNVSVLGEGGEITEWHEASEPASLALVTVALAVLGALAPATRGRPRSGSEPGAP